MCTMIQFISFSLEISVPIKVQCQKCDLTMMMKIMNGSAEALKIILLQHRKHRKYNQNVNVVKAHNTFLLHSICAMCMAF